MKYLFLALKFALVLAAVVGATACDYGDTVAAGGDTVVKPVAPTNQENVVCDPFNTQNPALQGHGLTAQMYYLLDSQPRYTDVMDYLNNGQPIDAAFYLNDVNVPTRSFDLGFFTQSGSLILNADGLPLYEYFAVDMQSTIILGPNDVAGAYQFAVLSDDGSILEIQGTPGGGYTTLINNDGTHPTLMGCESQAIQMSSTTQIPIKFHYYQGPRYHIALMLLWRPMPANPLDVVDPLCGVSGDTYYFDPTQNPSVPEQPYLALQSRGWKVLTSANYLLPQAAGATNPCAASGAPQISNLRVDGVTDTSAMVSWTTDINSSTQLAFELSTDSGYTFTSTDPTPTTTHSVTLTGLVNFGYYTVYGLSMSAEGQQSVSSTLNFRTLR